MILYKNVFNNKVSDISRKSMRIFHIHILRFQPLQIYTILGDKNAITIEHIGNDIV